MPGRNRIAETCPLDGCDEWHRLQFTIPHHQHALLKAAVDRSKFATMKELTLALFTRWMEQQPLTEGQPRQQLLLQYDELKVATRDEIRALCAQLGITQSGKTRSQMLYDIYALPYVKVEGKPGRPRGQTTPLR